MYITKKATVFLVLTFLVGWTASILSWWLGGADGEIKDLQIGGFINVFSPAFAALLCAMAFEKGARLEALGLSFRPNWWWLWALLIPAGIIALTILITALFSKYNLVGIEDMAKQLAAERRQQYSDATAYLARAAGETGIALIAYSLFFTVSEELGWRGYLYHLWRRFGFWRYSFATGIIWGVWHWPLIYLFGLNYPDQRALGLLLFPLFDMLFAALMTLVRDRGGSVWAAGIMHGSINALTILTIVTVDAAQFPWTLPGLSGIAAMSIGVLLIASFQLRDPQFGKAQEKKPH